jgi:CxxC motif-containing protein (DUF1111 family)
VRLSLPGTAPGGAPVPEPTHGDQLQPRAVAGVVPEGRVEVRATERPGTSPLWGLGRTQEVSGHTRLLHDGRARSVMKAIFGSL